MNSFADMVAGMERVTLIASLISCVVWHSASANLTVTPHDTESKVNDSTYFNCSTDILSKEIHWSHGSNDVYVGGSFYEPYLGRFRIEINNSTGVYNLVIPSVEPRDAGEYFCQDDGGHGKKSTAAKLIVLDDEPTCLSNSFQDGNGCGLQQDEVKLSCSVAYHGNIPPKLEWRKAGDNTLIEKATSVESGNITTYSITLKTDLSMDSQSYVCQTTRSVTSQYKCNSETIRLQYVFSGNARVNITIDEEVICSANSSQSCSYKWKWFSGSDSLTVSTDQTLKPTRVGSHRCEATCQIGNTSCVVDVMFAEVYSTEATSDRKMLFLLLLLLVIVLVTIGVVFILCRRHKRANKRPSTSQEIEANITVQEPSTVPLIAVHNNQVKQSEAEPNKDPKDEVETNTTDESATPLIGLKGEDKEQEKQNPAESDQGPKEVGAIKTDQPKAPLTASTAEDKKEVKQNDADPNKSTKGLSLLDGQPEIVSNIKLEGNITGVTVSKDKLVIATENPSAVDAYDVKTFTLMRRVPIKQLVNLFDIACYHLSDHVFISGSQLKTETKVIVRILILREDPTQIVDKLWSTGDDFGNLSVSSESNVLLCVSDKNKLIEYTEDGGEIRVITLHDLVHPRHAIKLPSGEFLVSHGFKNDTLHRVCNVNNNGEVVRPVDAEKGTSLQQLKDPNYLIVDEDGYVLVSDSCINLVLLFDSGLKHQREFVTKRAVLIDPSKMCLCKATRNLFVVHAVNDVLIFTIK